MTDLGEVRRHGDAVELILRRHIRRPVEKVWAAITVPERIADWFTRARIDGERLQLTFPDPYGGVEGRIVACEPMRLFAWTWPQPDGSETVVRFELEPDGDGCRLTLTETGLKPGSAAAGNGAGWHAHLEGLEAAADGVATPWDVIVARSDAWRAAYDALAAA